ncbi:MAG TPA: energy transducer TonB [Terriglobales bacterium]|nr:energy transducer TonB [Terriglobales bacterium]
MTHRSAFALLVLLWAAALIPGHSLAQQQEEQTASKRKVVNRVVPAYPQLARTMNLKGTVRIEALVAPNGVVKSVSVKGGHPVLVQAAENAIQKWRWEPATRETHEPIEVSFDPK